MKKEFYRAHVKDFITDCSEWLYVFATSAGAAEKKALKIIRVRGVMRKPRCAEISYMGSIDG